jgi:pantoate--beta-alanine ligase
MLGLPVEIVPCPIVREPDGLAMSSRNVRLSPEHRIAAPRIYETLRNACADYSWFTPLGIAGLVTTQIELDPLLQVEYAEVADAETLQPFTEWGEVAHAVICVAVFAGDVRLIDNYRIF